MKDKILLWPLLFTGGQMHFDPQDPEERSITDMHKAYPSSKARGASWWGNSQGDGWSSFESDINWAFEQWRRSPCHR